MWLPPHSKLKEVTIDHLFLDDSFFKTMTAENFPNLRMVKISEDSCFLIELNDNELRDMVQCQGIDLELLPNADNIVNSFNLNGEQHNVTKGEFQNSENIFF